MLLTAEQAAWLTLKQMMTQRKEADCNVIPQNERRGKSELREQRKYITETQSDRGDFVVKVVQT